MKLTPALRSERRESRLIVQQWFRVTLTMYKWHPRVFIDNWLSFCPSHTSFTALEWSRNHGRVEFVASSWKPSRNTLATFSFQWGTLYIAWVLFLPELVSARDLKCACISRNAHSYPYFRLVRLKIYLVSEGNVLFPFYVAVWRTGTHSWQKQMLWPQVACGMLMLVGVSKQLYLRKRCFKQCSLCQVDFLLNTSSI